MPTKEKKEVLHFDLEERRKYLTGFQKRKTQRREYAEREKLKKEKVARKQTKQSYQKLVATRMQDAATSVRDSNKKLDKLFKKRNKGMCEKRGGETTVEVPEVGDSTEAEKKKPLEKDVSPA
eukprot:GHVU01151709.1.p1 GENE.GHVU01151709.1~~GHVU01151709.1.p1  ORF type:complete len:122 (+),score=33.32 GHVU01151709.1:133-498(+)